jgi:ribonuclease Z
MLALTILGNNSAVPAFGRNPTAQVLQTLEDSFLIDCGEGTQMQMMKHKIRRARINHIFISHLHGDHYFGLIGLLTSMSLLGRTHSLHLYAPPELEEIINKQLEVASALLSFQLYFHAIIQEGLLLDDKTITISCFQVIHRIKCWGFLFKEKKKLRGIDIERVRAHEIPRSFYVKLQEGEDYVDKKGGIIFNAEVTHAATTAKSYAYSADTIYDESIIEKIKGVDLLYHETTYLKAYEERALAHFHSTTVQAASIAKKACVKKLIIGHFSSKYETLEEFLIETTSIFKNTELALEGTCFKI